MALTDSQTEYFEHQVLLAAAGALTWLCWDVMIHFDQEVESIWRRPRSWVKAMYFFIRYIPIFHEGAVLTLDRGITFSTAGCKGWIYWELIFAELLTFAVEIILVMRLYIMYSRNKVVLACILVVLMAEVSVMAVMLGITLPRLKYGPTCLISSSPGIFMAFWLSSLVFETFLFVLTLVKFFQSVTRNLGKHSILFIFVVDGTWAFALIFVAMLLNMLMYKLANSPLVGMGYYWCLSVMSFSGSHILLNLRSIGLHDGNTTLTSGSSFSAARRGWDSNFRSERRSYFTTAIDIDDPYRPDEGEAVQLKTIDQVLQEVETA